MKKTQRVDLHNHTTLCNHASGSMEEYVKKAIEVGIDVFGFSDHAPMPFDPKYRMDISEKSFYEKEVLYLRDKYSNDIDILLGYEVDFMQNKKLMLDEVLNSKVDYFIGSIHFLQEKDSNIWGFDNPEFIGKYKEKDIDEIWIDYFDGIEQLAKSNLFDIIGHIDLIKLFNYLPNKEIKTICFNALKAIKKHNLVLEINSAGLRKPIKQTYPSKDILELAYELDIPITFSSDAHSVEQIGFKYEVAKSLAKEVGYSKCIKFKHRDREIIEF